MGIWDSAQFSVKKSFEQNKYLPNQLIFSFLPIFFTLMSNHIVVIPYALLSVTKGWSQPSFRLKNNLSCFQELSAAVPTMDV